MSTSSKLIYWDSLDPFLIGPYSCPNQDFPLPFEVPGKSSREYWFGRIFPGENWPAYLAPIDRIAPVPVIQHNHIQQKIKSRDVVLYCEMASGERIPVCAKHEGDRVYWNVNPVAWIRGILAEEYVLRWKRPIMSRIPLINYSYFPHFVKGILVRLQNHLSQKESNSTPFPLFPFDDFIEEIRIMCLALTFDSTPQTIDIWPRNYQAAITLTHDVDTSWILNPKRWSLLREILDTETSLGYKGAWYITGNKVHIPKHTKSLQYITDAGHETGLHGWNHDSQLKYLKAPQQEKRVQQSLDRLRSIPVAGMRTPWYCRSPQLFDVLSHSFLYDSSVPNASDFYSSVSNSGCCTIFPYQIRPGFYELPMTLPPDNFSDMRGGYDILREVADRIIEKRGVVVVIFHPQPHQSANEKRLSHYFSFLKELAEHNKDRLWSATPRKIVRRYQERLGEGCGDGRSA